MKRIFKNKRGVAMETAILFMLTMAISSIMLTSVLLHTHLHISATHRPLEVRTRIQQIGEYFVYQNETDFLAGMQGSSYIPETSYENNNKTLTLKNQQGEVVLYIEIVDGQIVRWQYTLQD